MESLTIEPTDELPKIVLDPANNNFEISGISLPEDAKEFYFPILQWLDQYGQSPNEDTNLVMQMDYFNTASSKPLIEILCKLEELHEAGKKVTITWCYADDDEDMMDSGEEFADIVKVPFVMKSI